MASLQDVTDLTAKLLAGHFKNDETYQVAIDHGMVLMRLNDQVFKLKVEEHDYLTNEANAKDYIDRFTAVKPRQ